MKKTMLTKGKNKTITKLGEVAKDRKIGHGNERKYTKKAVSKRIARAGLDYSKVKKTLFPTLEKPDADIARIITYFKSRDEVAVLYIFGSLRKGRATGESDIDIAVLIDEARQNENFELLKKHYYAASAGFSLRPVDIVILNSAPAFLKYHILKTGKILFEKQRRLRLRFTEKAITEYLDYKPVEDICLKAVADRFRRQPIGR